MTENEAKDILRIIGFNRAEEGDVEDCEAIDVAMNALEEIQAYRAIGTVEDIQKKMEELDRWHTDRINENIKNPFAYTSTLICHNCDHKDDYIEELEAEVEEYKSVGTIEELKALKEKSEDIPIIHGKAELELHDKEIYAKGYNQGTIDRAEEVTKAREHGYANAIDEVLESVKKAYHNFSGYNLEKMTKYGNESAEQQHESYSTLMMYEIAGEFDDLIDTLEQLKAP